MDLYSGVPRVSGARGEDENWRPLPPACRTGKRRRRSPLLLGGGSGSPSRQRFLEYLGVNGTHFWISFNTIFNSTCHTDKRRKRFPLLLGKGGSGVESQPPTLLGAFGCEWNPFLNCVNTIFNSACKTGKRRRRSLSRYWRSGAEPQQPTPFGELRCKWNPFFNSINDILNSFGAHGGYAACGPHS